MGKYGISKQIRKKYDKEDLKWENIQNIPTYPETGGSNMNGNLEMEK